MKIILLEPFFTGSHKKWALGFQKHSSHEVTILSLKGKHWKWRMHGAAISLAKQYDELDFNPDLILATDMLDFTTFLALTRSKTAQIKTAIYFHENQLTYPWSSTDHDIKLKRDFHYGFINYTSALVADKVLFNSKYHKNSFLEALPKFLRMYPDHNEFWTIDKIKAKSQVLYLGMDLSKNVSLKNNNKTPVLLWNHRWEYDKNPVLFFDTLKRLKEGNISFQLIILGEKTKKHPKCFDEAKEIFKEEIIHFAYVENESEYLELLNKSDFLPVTSNQDFFGGSIVEAMSQNVTPLLPKRLSYPEHLNLEQFPELFFESENEFFEKLKFLIKGYPKEKTISFREMVLKYDWNIIITEYDNVLNF